MMVFDMTSCTGCRTCEMACSVKHIGEFSPSMSAIKIVDKENASGFLVSLAEKDEGHGLDCVGCRECLHYCISAEDLGKIILLFLRKTKDQKARSIKSSMACH